MMIDRRRVAFRAWPGLDEWRWFASGCLFPILFKQTAQWMERRLDRRIELRLVFPRATIRSGVHFRFLFGHRTRVILEKTDLSRHRTVVGFGRLFRK